MFRMFEQLSSWIGWRVMVVQSDARNMAHTNYLGAEGVKEALKSIMM